MRKTLKNYSISIIKLFIRKVLNLDINAHDILNFNAAKHFVKGISRRKKISKLEKKNKKVKE